MTWLAAPVLALAQYGPGLVFGEDPTRPLTRLEAEFSSVDARGGGTLQSLRARADYAFDERFVVRADWGVERADAAGRGAESGIGDLRLSGGWRAFDDPAFAMAFGVGVVLGTAGDPLGSGHDQIVLTAAAAAELPEIRSHVYEDVAHYVSFDGSSDRPGVALTSIDLGFVTEWSPKSWTRVGGEFLIDWKGGEHTALNASAAYGRVVGRHVSVFVEPAFGLFGDDVPGAVDARLTIGARWLF